MASEHHSEASDGEGEFEIDDDDEDEIRDCDISHPRRKRLRTMGSPTCSNEVCKQKLIPKKMIVICTMLLTIFGAPQRVDSVELFAGCQSVCKGMKGVTR